MDNRFDIAVIGGGPAGAFTALRLALRGAQVILIDRRSDGAGKTCGHCLNRRCFSLLAEAGILDTIEHSSEQPTEALTIHLSDAVCIRSRFASRRSEAGLIVRRDRFDRILLDAAARAGATIVRSASARILGHVDDQMIEVEVRTSEQTHELMRIRSPLIIGADGIGSGVASSFSLLGPPRSCGRSIGFSFDVHHTDLEHLPRHSIEMFVHGLGYMGIVRENESDSAHIAGYIRGRRAHRPNVLTFVHKITQRFHLLKRTFTNGISRNAFVNLSVCGPMPFRPRRICAAHVALIGDAAGYVEPFTGEGMSCAIESADLLARVLTRFDLHWSRAAQHEYAACWERYIGVMHNRCRLTCAMVRYALPLVRTGVFGSFPRTATDLMAARIATPWHGAAWTVEEGCR